LSRGNKVKFLENKDTWVFTGTGKYDQSGNLTAVIPSTRVGFFKEIITATYNTITSAVNNNDLTNFSSIKNDANGSLIKWSQPIKTFNYSYYDGTKTGRGDIQSINLKFYRGDSSSEIYFIYDSHIADQNNIYTVTNDIQQPFLIKKLKHTGFSGVAIGSNGTTISYSYARRSPFYWEVNTTFNTTLHNVQLHRFNDLLFNSSNWILVGEGSETIIISSDMAGGNYQKVVSGGNILNEAKSIAWDNKDKYVVVGEAKTSSTVTIITSVDGTNWTEITNSKADLLEEGHTIIWDGSRFIATGTLGGVNKIIYSPDGTNWQTRDSPGPISVLKTLNTSNSEQGIYEDGYIVPKLKNYIDSNCDSILNIVSDKYIDRYIENTTFKIKEYKS
jgi:hypothetical protein